MSSDVNLLETVLYSGKYHPKYCDSLSLYIVCGIVSFDWKKVVYETGAGRLVYVNYVVTSSVFSTAIDKVVSFHHQLKSLPLQTSEQTSTTNNWNHIAKSSILDHTGHTFNEIMASPSINHK